MGTVEEIVEGIDQLREELSQLLASPDSEERRRRTQITRWANRAHTQLSDWGMPQEANGLSAAHYQVLPNDPHGGLHLEAKAKDDFLKSLRDDMAAHPEHYQSKLTPAKPQSSGTETKTVTPGKVFLGHGRSKLWARVQIHLKDDLGLDVGAWESESRAGLDSVEVLKGLLAACRFAVIVATGEDTTAEGAVRARQNVIHEIGLFQGRLGFEKVALLEQEGIEGFSNLAGLQVVPFPSERIEAAFYELDRMLKREGIIKTGFGLAQQA